MTAGPSATSVFMRLSGRLMLLGLSVLASALMAGFFWTYSVSVMPGLAVGDPLAAVRAMQGINRVIRTPMFAFAFFGALAFPLAAAMVCTLQRRVRAAIASFAGAVIYGLGAFAVTFLVNVPLNESLAAQAATDAELATRIWRAYAEPWTAWNHLRSAAALAAFVFAGTAFVIDRRS